VAVGRHARSAVVTLGERGALCVHSGTVTHVAAPTVSTVDTTGAGDAFVGALAVALARGLDLVAAARIATEVAAYSVTRRGAQPSYPTLADLPASATRQLQIEPN
jgi:ribokinase